MATDLISSIIQFALDGKTAGEMVRFVSDAHGLSIKKAVNFIKQLADTGVLISNLYQNIPGRDYLNRLAGSLRALDIPVAIKMLRKKACELKETTHFIKRMHSGQRSPLLHSIRKLLSAKSALYINVEWPICNGTLSKKIQEKFWTACTASIY